MDKAVRDKMEQKILDVASRKDEVDALARAVSVPDNLEHVALGIVAGRLYNAFYYQTRRILGRDPTNTEFEEFLEMLESRNLNRLW